MRPTGTVLFLCPHGAAKSVLAAARFNQVATARGLSLVGRAAGTAPDPQFLPRVVQAVQELGVDLSGQAPRPVTAGDLQAAWRVVSFGCDLTGLLAPGQAVEYWDDVAPLSQDFAAGQAVIAAHVRSLVAEVCAASAVVT